MKLFFAEDGRAINRFEIEVENSDTVLQIKEKIQNSQGIAISDQTLIFKGNILHDDVTVEASGAEDQSRIRLVVHKLPEKNEEETDDDDGDEDLPKKKMKTEAADSNSNDIPIQLKLPPPLSDLMKLTVNADQTVLQLKRLISSTSKEVETASESSGRRLVIRNEEGIDLPDDKTLSDCQISSESVVTVEIPPKMTLLLKIPGSNEFFSVDIRGEDTILQLKEIIHESEGTRVDRILVKDHEGNDLSDHRTLTACGITPDSELAVEYQLPAREGRPYFTEATFCWLTHNDRGCVLPVRNQYRTRCCYAFVVMDTLYALQYLHGRPPYHPNHPVEGSEQEMLDYLHLYYRPQSRRYDPNRIPVHGVGNRMINAYKFVKNHGVAFASDRPFLGRYTPYPGLPQLPQLTGRRIFIERYTIVYSVAEAFPLIRRQPIGASILCPRSLQIWPTDRHRRSQNVRSIYTGPAAEEWRNLYAARRTNSDPPFRRHAVTIVGYGRANNVQYRHGIKNNVDYFIAKTSWYNWGFDSYIKIAADIPDPYDSYPFYAYFAMPTGPQIRTV